MVNQIYSFILNGTMHKHEPRDLPFIAAMCFFVIWIIIFALSLNFHLGLVPIL
jgi:hypothetical protein